MKVERVTVDFPVPVELPEGWDRRLVALVAEVCAAYEAENQGRVMWPAGVGAAVLWREPEEPGFDDSVLAIEVCEREDYHNARREGL